MVGVPYIFVNCYLHGVESLNWANRQRSCCWQQLLLSVLLPLLLLLLSMFRQHAGLVGVACGLAHSRALALHRNAIKTGSAYSEMRAMLSDLPANTCDQLTAPDDAPAAAAAAAAAAAEVAAAGRRLFFCCLSTLRCVMKVDKERRKGGREGDREKLVDC